MGEGKFAAILFIGLIAGFFISAQPEPPMMPGPYQLGYGCPITTNRNGGAVPLMLDTRTGALFYFQSVQVGNAARGQWIAVEEQQPPKHNDKGIRFTPAPNG